jgi:hypothetical protein
VNVRFGVFVIMLLLVPRAGEAKHRPFRVACQGLEAYAITGTFDTDWGWGMIRTKTSGTIAFAVGHPVAEAVPAERPAGFRTFHVETIGDVLIRHGYFVRKKEYRATVVGGPISRQFVGSLQLSGSEGDSALVRSLARKLAVAPCKVTFESAPPN